MLLAIFVASLLAGEPSKAVKPTYAEAITQTFKSNVSVVESATSVDLFHIKPLKPKGPGPSPSDPTIGGYPLAGEGVKLSPDGIAKIRAVLLDPSSYPVPMKCRPGLACGSGKGCMFDPGIALRFVAVTGANTQRADVLLCFNCDDIAVVGTERGFDDFSRGRAALVRALKSAAPADTAIQALDEKHG